MIITFKAILWTLLFCGVCCHQPATISASDRLRELDGQSLRVFFAFPLQMIVQAYRSFVGKGVQSVCPMYPSCSAYGHEALRSSGVLVGSLQIVDRLNRCGHDTFVYPVVNADGRFRYSDPVHETQ